MTGSDSATFLTISSDAMLDRYIGEYQMHFGALPAVVAVSQDYYDQLYEHIVKPEILAMIKSLEQSTVPQLYIDGILVVVNLIVETKGFEPIPEGATLH